MGVAQIPRCENAMMPMLPGILIATSAMPHVGHSYNPYLFVILAGLINSFLYGVIALLIIRGRSYASIKKTSVLLGLVAMSALVGFHSASAPIPASTSTTQPTTHYPNRPTTTAYAANTHTFGSIHLPQDVIDARSPIIWFHIYRGPKCASEKYAGKLPCGPSYRASGEFTLGSFHDPTAPPASPTSTKTTPAPTSNHA